MRRVVGGASADFPCGKEGSLKRVFGGVADRQE